MPAGGASRAGCRGALLASALFFGALGVFWSASAQRTAAATVGAYAGAVAVFVATLVVGLGSPYMGGVPFRSVNALSAVWHATDPEVFFTGTLPSWIRPGATP